MDDQVPEYINLVVVSRFENLRPGRYVCFPGQLCRATIAALGAGSTIQPASPQKAKRAELLNVRAFRQVEYVLDVHFEIADSTLNLGMPEENLDSPQIVGRFKDD